MLTKRADSGRCSPKRGSRLCRSVPLAQHFDEDIFELAELLVAAEVPTHRWVETIQTA
jgi:hypothetical protein